MKEVYEFILSVLEETSKSIGIHDVRLLKKDRKKNLAFDISLKQTLKEEEESRLKGDLTQKLRSRFEDLDRVYIQIEPLFSY